MNMNNILFDYEAFPQLETDRLILREIRPGDAEALLRIFGDDEVARYYDIAAFTSLEQAQQLIQGMAERFKNKARMRWGITLKGENLVIGTCGYPTWHKSQYLAEIGYDLARAFWNKGITTEAVAAMLKFGFERMALHRVEAMVMPKNTASMKLLSKLGFQEEGILRERGFWKSEFHDLKLLALLRRDFGLPTFKELSQNL